ncbi:MAG TPA: phosphotransferase [Gallionella sp.]|nr:phosphotransferase [Gallionella sp.]
MLNSYGINAPVISKIDVPSHNIIYKIQDVDASYVVKIYYAANFTPPRAGSQAEHIYYEDEILRRLENCETPVIPVARDIQGRSILDIGSRKAMVFRYIDGSRFDDSVIQITRSAEALAKIHHCLPKDAIATRDFDYKSFISLWINRLPVLCASPRFTELIYDTASFNKVSKQIASWLEHEPDWQILPWVHGHGDMHPRNFLYKDDAVFVFDFQAARFMPRLGDIADGMIEFGIFKDALIPERMKCFLDHYEAVFPLTEIERSHMKEFLLTEAVTKIITTLEADFSQGYKASPDRMKALLDFCLNSADFLRIAGDTTTRQA